MIVLPSWASKKFAPTARRPCLAKYWPDDSAFGCELLYLWEAEAFLEKHKRKLIDMEGLQPQALFAKAPRIDFHTRSTVGFQGNADLLAEAVKTRIAGGYQVLSLCRRSPDQY